MARQQEVERKSTKTMTTLQKIDEQLALCEKATPWLRGQVAKAEKAVRHREEAEKCWRSGDDKEWATVAKMSGGKAPSKKERLEVAARENRIAVMCRHELEMFKALMDQSTNYPAALRMLRVAVEALEAVNEWFASGSDPLLAPESFGRVTDKADDALEQIAAEMGEGKV